MITDFKAYLQQKAGLSDADFDKLEPALLTKQISKGTVLLRQDEVCSEVYFISSGLLRAYTVDNAGKEHVIQFAPENWWLSDRNSFLFNEPALFFIDAIEDTEIIVLTHSFFDIAGSIQKFTDFNTRALHNQVRLHQQRINLLIGATAEDRYIDFIERYPNLLLRVPQWMIASYLGITPESLSRVRKELARRNFKPHK